jgi:hypothetical protein
MCSCKLGLPVTGVMVYYPSAYPLVAMLACARARYNLIARASPSLSAVSHYHGWFLAVLRDSFTQSVNRVGLVHTVPLQRAYCITATIIMRRAVYSDGGASLAKFISNCESATADSLTQVNPVHCLPPWVASYWREGDCGRSKGHSQASGADPKLARVSKRAEQLRTLPVMPVPRTRSVIRCCQCQREVVTTWKEGSSSLSHVCQGCGSQLCAA